MDSAALRTELAQPGVFAYAVWFDSNQTTPQWTPLVTNGTIENAGTIPV